MKKYARVTHRYDGTKNAECSDTGAKIHRVL